MIRARTIGWGLLRLALAGLFIYAGLLKLWDVVPFAASIVRFQIVPHFLVHPIVLSLPPMEILCGMALLIGPWKRPAALALALLSVLFLAAIVSATARGIAVECSCFGGTVAEPLWRLITRDILLLAAASSLYLRTLRQRGRGWCSK